MKKLIFAVATMSLLSYSSFAQAADDKKDENKKAVYDALFKDISEAGLPEEQAKPLADCMATKIVDNLSDEEIQTVLKADEQNPPSQEIMEKVGKVGEECMGEM